MSQPTEHEFTDLDAALEEVIPRRVRTVTYAVAGSVGALSTGALPLARALFPEHGETVALVVAGVVSLCATVAGLVGVAYRPTR